MPRSLYIVVALVLVVLGGRSYLEHRAESLLVAAREMFEDGDPHGALDVLDRLSSNYQWARTRGEAWELTKSIHESLREGEITRDEKRRLDLFLQQHRRDSRREKRAEEQRLENPWAELEADRIRQEKEWGKQRKEYERQAEERLRPIERRRRAIRRGH